jgi:hypothetical protein
MRLDHEHQEFMTVAQDALTEWRAVTARPEKDTPGGAYQVFDYPRVAGATAFLFYWPASIEITFAGYLPQATGASQRTQIEFVTHLSRLMGQLGFPVEVHGTPGDHPFKAQDGTAAAARLRAVATEIGRNRGYVLIGLAEDTRGGDDRAADEEPEAPAADDSLDDE